VEKSLVKTGYSVSYRTVARILNEQEYSLQANRKTSEGMKDHPDRDQQFRYINEQAKQFLRESQPVISVDTKKKELVGNYKNGGREWKNKGRAVEVLSHDFPDPTVPKSVPYGIYNIGDNTGWVTVGVDADAAEFAVESIRQWWRWMGKRRYPKAKGLLICADSGGSNGYRSHLWKRELQVNVPPNSPEYERAVAIWAQRVRTTAMGASVSTHLEASLKLAIPQMLPEAEVTPVSLEFGTVPPMEVFKAVRAENWLHHHAGPEHRKARELKARLLRAFHPDSEEWQTSVWDQGKEAVDGSTINPKANRES